MSNSITIISERLNAIVEEHNKLAKELTEINASKAEHEARMAELRGAANELNSLIQAIQYEDATENSSVAEADTVEVKE